MTIPAGYSKVRMSEFDAIVDVSNNVVGMVDADGTELWFAAQARNGSGAIAGLVGAGGTTLRFSYPIAEKTDVTLGAIQTADQVIGRLAVPANSLQVGDVFRVVVAVGRDVNTDAFGANSHFRLGTAGTTSDTTTGSFALSSVFPAGSGSLSYGMENWFRVVSIGANSVIERVGSGSNLGSFNLPTGSSAALAVQTTLTGYNLTTQAGFVSMTTNMAAATATKPATGYMRLEKM